MDENTISLLPRTTEAVNNNATFSSLNYTDLPHPVIMTSRSLELTRFIVQRILAPILVSGGVIGNIFTIIVLRNPKMRSSTNVYLTALAICDMLYLIFMFTLSFVSCENSDQSKFFFYFIPYGRPFSDLFGNTAVWLTVAFTLERYVGVVHPMRGKAWCTVGKAKIATGIVFIISTLNTFPEFFEMEIFAYQSDKQGGYRYRCQNTDFSKTDSYQIGYFWWFTTFFTFVPLVLLSVFNSALIKSVWKANKNRRTLSNSSVLGENSRQATEQQKVTTMLISVVIIFLICQLPWAVLLLYKAYLSANNLAAPSNALRIAGNICNLLVELNASVNFILYSYFSSRFRRTFRKIICRCTKKQQKNRLSNSSDTFRKSSSKDSTTVTSVSSNRSKRGTVSDVSVRESLIQRRPC